MRIVELILDEEQEYSGIEAISIVEKPAIEEDFITLNKDAEYKLAEYDNEKRILLGALLIPNKPILRMAEDGEYYIYFSKDTVRKASELYLMEGNQNNATLEHQMQLKGLTLVESWIVEDQEQDKTAFYGLKYPVGTWVGAVKVHSDKVWQEFVKTGAVKGFSIEGYFQDKSAKKESNLSAIEMKEAEHLLAKIKDIVTGVEVTLESYSQKINDEFAIIDDRLAYSTPEKAEEIAKSIGCEGHHVHNFEDQDWYMPCKTHNEEEELKKPCYDGYEMIGTKMKNGKKVPNCVPIKK